MTICKVCTKKRDGKEGRTEGGGWEERKEDPDPGVLFITQVVLIKFNSLEEPQRGLLNSSNISEVWVEHFNFLFPEDTMDNDPIPPLILRNFYTTEMSRFDKTVWHGISIRNQFIRITAPVEFHNMEIHRGKKLKIIFIDVSRVGKSWQKAKKKIFPFSNFLMLINTLVFNSFFLSTFLPLSNKRLQIKTYILILISYYLLNIM